MAKAEIKVDLHTHTIASGHALSTVKEMIDYTALKGLEMIAITDHGLNMPGGPHEYYFYKLLELPRYISNVEVLRGVEANILDLNGSLDMPEFVLANLDIVLAGFHDQTGYQNNSVEENTKAMIAALHNPYVHVITHPGNPQFPVDLERIVQAAKITGKALEINNSSFSFSRPGSTPRCQELARLAAKENILVTVNSDAHSCYEIGETSKALETAERAGIRNSQILNTSAQKVNNYLMSMKQKQRKIS